jgi:hypothetical protein
MAFKRDEVEDLLARCFRCCCICHRYCGVKIETDHVKPQAEEGGDDIDNAIPVCFDCHAEIHSYNDKHPRGRKFTPGELAKHKEQWLKLCRDHPDKVLMRPRESDTEVGPLQALVDEIDYNLEAAELAAHGHLGCPFRSQQFDRAIHTGSISLLAPELKDAIIKAYAAVGTAHVATLAQAKAAAEEVYQEGVIKTYGANHHGEECLRLLKDAQAQLIAFLGRAEGDHSGHLTAMREARGFRYVILGLVTGGARRFGRLRNTYNHRAGRPVHGGGEYLHCTGTLAHSPLGSVGHSRFRRWKR